MSKKLFAPLAVMAIMSTPYSMAFAKVDCQPFKQGVQAQQDVVEQMSSVFAKLEAKVETLENKIYDREGMIQSAEFKIQEAAQAISQIIDQQEQVHAQLAHKEAKLSAKQSEQRQFENIIQETQYDINNLPSRSNARRQAMRENMRAKKSLEKVEQKIAQIQQSMQPALNQLGQLQDEKQAAQGMKAQFEMDKQDVLAMKPSLQRLKSKKNKAQQELMAQDSVQQDNLAILAEEEEKVLMCKTYNIKYPKAKKVAKQIYKVGCDNYVFADFNTVHAQDAQQEVFAKICD